MTFTRLMTVAALTLASPLVLGQTHTYCCT
ncbi:MAG: hypothetical protein JWM03_1174, partial [Rhodocyclales bacterium]|nr:hypothetical protein [Rhodocyclales bacterium]